MINKIFYNYSQIDNLVRESGNYVKNEFNPDIILAIGGGGLIPARILRSILEVPIYVITISTYDENDKPIKEPRIVQWMDFSVLKDKKILIVDEVDDTRKTLSFLVDKLVNEENLNSENLGFFVLHNKIKEKVISKKALKIGYYKSGLEVEDKWIIYPWD